MIGLTSVGWEDVLFLEVSIKYKSSFIGGLSEHYIRTLAKYKQVVEAEKAQSSPKPIVPKGIHHSVFNGLVISADTPLRRLLTSRKLVNCPASIRPLLYLWAGYVITTTLAMQLVLVSLGRSSAGLTNSSPLLGRGLAECN